MTKEWDTEDMSKQPFADRFSIGDRVLVYASRMGRESRWYMGTVVNKSNEDDVHWCKVQYSIDLDESASCSQTANFIRRLDSNLDTKGYLYLIVFRDGETGSEFVVKGFSDEVSADKEVLDLNKCDDWIGRYRVEKNNR